MPVKTPFTDKQHEILLRAVKHASQDKKRFKNQEQLALAIGMTQPSLSAYLLGKWRPGVTIARGIAHLEGVTLEELVGEFGVKDEGKTGAKVKKSGYPNLETCIDFYASTHTWAAWTLAAARAGYFGPEDFPPPRWMEKLDGLEKLLDRSRKAG